ncbi:protein of unknown function [Brevefilum fermentans]|uniref:Uncharacterized protein n=1 Tax=Candidatus Brevifilum fermentans TaxID=1986204 RepID=A0A1Y6K423_9CHLR|nr:protein of unknown function [Brevefilum fermentans]
MNLVGYDGAISIGLEDPLGL